MPESITPNPTEPPAPPALSPPRWRQVEARARSDRRRLRVVAGLTLLMVGSGLATLTTWYRPLGRPALLVLGGPASGFEALPQVTGDRAALRRLAGFDPIGPESAALADGSAIIRTFASASTLVVFLSARAQLVDPTRGSQVRFGADGPTLAELLARLSRQPASPRFLILDVAPPPDDPRAGAPDPDQTLTALHIQLAEWFKPGGGNTEAARRVAVLVSAGPGQRPLDSAALGRSVCGYYVEQGLRGAADGSGDGRITARELANYTRDCVGRHARRVFGLVQTPILYGGEAADLALIATPRRPAAPDELPKDAPAYPDWLALAWRERDALRSGGAPRQAPRPFAQFEAALLGADRAWRGRVDPARVRSDLRLALEPLRARIAATRAIPRRPAYSLAQGVVNGAPVTEEFTQRAVTQALIRRPEPRPDARPGEAADAELVALAQFFEPAPPQPPQTQPEPRFRSPVDLAGAVFGVAATETTPTPGAIGFLDRLLARVSSRPAFSETAALRRLAQLGSGWRPDQAHRWLSLVADAERLQAEPIGWLGDPEAMTEAVRLTHEAQVVFEARNFATPAEVDRRLSAARDAVDIALAHQTLLQAARDLADDASRLLPDAAALLTEAPDLEPAWLAAADEAAAIFDRLGRLEVPDRRDAGRKPRLDPSDLSNRVGALREALVPFEAPRIAARVAAASRREPPPEPAEIRAALALLATPLPTAEGRVTLWETAIAAERQRVADILRLDAGDGTTVAPVSSDQASATGPPIDPRDSPRTLRRGRITNRLLALGGIDEAGPEDQPTARLGPNLMEGHKKQASFARDRLARLVPPWLGLSELDTPELDPTRERRTAEYHVLRHHLALRYAFEARDAGGSEFAAEAARAFGDPADPPAPILVIDSDPPQAQLDPTHPEINLNLTLRSVGGVPVGPIRGEVAASASPWLALSAGTPWPDGPGSPPDEPTDPLRFDLASSSGPVVVPVRVRIRDEGDTPTEPIPPGVIVRARFGYHTAHRLIPLTIEPASHRLRVAFTEDPAGTGPDLPEVRLRVLQGRVPLHLSVRNPGLRERRVIAELVDRRGPIARASAPVVIPAGGSSRVAFGPPSAKPEEGFGVIRGPLTVRLTDPTGAIEPVERVIPAGLADPTRFVQLVQGQFEPGEIREEGRSQLTLRLRAVGPIVGPPCPVVLTLNPTRIPGLLSPGEGKYSDKLTRIGDEVTLTVDGIEVDRLGEGLGLGLIDLAIDGLARAYVLRVPMGNRSARSAPMLVTQPTVGLRLDPAARPGTPVRVDLDVSSPPEAGRIVVELGRPNRAGGFDVDEVREIDALRGTLRLNPTGPDGALLFEGSAEAPTVTLNLGSVRGLREVRARLLDETNRTLATASAPLILDDRPPQGLELIAMPKYGLRGGKVDLRARAARVPPAGFREVVFFVGRPVDGKRPAGAEAGRPTDGSRTTWTTNLPLGDTKPGQTPVSVEFVTGVGLSEFATATLEVVEVIPPEPTTIRGVVREGQLPQPGLEVVIRDDKGVEKRRVKTGEAGQYEVAGLPPGSYRVISGRPTPPLVGSDEVTLGAGETKTLNIPLYYP